MEQKNGAVVRRLVGYGRLHGLAATRLWRELYAVFAAVRQLLSAVVQAQAKMRDGARVHKTYHPPMTPCDRLLGSAHGDRARPRRRCAQQFTALDPVRLLQEIRAAQQTLAGLAASGTHEQAAPAPVTDVATFLKSLSVAWQGGEVRPTHRKPPGATRWWRSRADPFEHVWPVVEHWLDTEPAVTAPAMMERLATMVPDVYAGNAQLRTLQRRVKQWRSERAKELILGHLRRALPTPSTEAETATT